MRLDDVVGVKSSSWRIDLSGGLPMRDQDARDPKVMSDDVANASSLTLAMPFLPVFWVKASKLQIGDRKHSSIPACESV